MYITLQQEKFSYAYLQTIAVAAGYELQAKGRAMDNAGIDIAIEVPGQIGRVLSPKLDAQVKCTTDLSIIRADFIHYPLDVRNYQRLRHPHPSCPQFLFLVFVPPDHDSWLIVLEDQSILKKCAYWFSLKGMPLTSNKQTITIRIPRVNLMTPQTLQQIMFQIAED
jgi:Domain of unknown function (DUF4365)